jgi:hypothetical protein
MRTRSGVVLAVGVAVLMGFTVNGRAAGPLFFPNVASNNLYHWYKFVDDSGNTNLTNSGLTGGSLAVYMYTQPYADWGITNDSPYPTNVGHYALNLPAGETADKYFAAYMPYPDPAFMHMYEANDSMTIATWIKFHGWPTQAGGTYLGIANHNYWSFGLHNPSQSGNPFLYLYMNKRSDGGWLYQFSGSTINFPIDSWNHVAVTWAAGNGNPKFYINGAYAGTSGGNDFGTNTCTYWPWGTYIGKQNWSYWGVNSAFADYRVYDKELTQAEIMQLTELKPPNKQLWSPEVQQTNLLHWYKFADGQGNPTLKNFGTAAGYGTTNIYLQPYASVGFTNDTPYRSIDPRYLALDLPGGWDNAAQLYYMTLPGLSYEGNEPPSMQLTEPTNAITISTWLKFHGWCDQAGGTWAQGILTHCNANVFTPGWSLCLYGDGLGGNAGLKFMMGRRSDGTVLYQSTDASVSFPTQVWTHVAMTWQAGSGNPAFYINGVACTSAGDNFGTNTASLWVNGTRIGMRDWQYWGMNGSVMDFRVYDKVLTQGDIQLLMKKPPHGSAVYIK